MRISRFQLKLMIIFLLLLLIPATMAALFGRYFFTAEQAIDADERVEMVLLEASEIVEEAMREVVTIAKAAHVHLSEEDIKNWYSILSTLSPQGKTSMLQDVEATRKTEVEMFAGKVTELGKTYGIPTPVNQTLLRMISVIEQRYGK